MKTNRNQRRGFTLVELLVVIVIIAALAGLTAPMVIRQRKKADQTEATNNARQIGLALFEFETEFGSYPDAGTAETINGNDDSHGLNITGTTYSNDYFRQLIASGIVQAETLFYAKDGFAKKPDNVYTGDKALARGEVGFGYILREDGRAYNTAGNPARPLIATPLAEGSTDGTFNPEPFDKKAVVLRIDNSVTSLTISNKDSKVGLGGGKTLLETGADTVWGASANGGPKILPPEY